MTQVFSKEWFDRHQLRLVRFANTAAGRAVLGIPQVPVIGISPAGFSSIKGIDLKNRRMICECKAGSNGIYARRLRKYGAPLWWVLHAMDWAALDRQRLVPSFGFATLTQYSGYRTANYFDAAYLANGGATGVSWADLRGTAGYRTASDLNEISPAAMLEGGTSAWRYLRRSGWNFDTSSILPAGHVTAATFWAYRYSATCSFAPWSTTNNDIIFVAYAPVSIAGSSVADWATFSGGEVGTLAWNGTGGNWGNVFAGGGTTAISAAAIIRAGATSLMAMFRGDNQNATPSTFSAGSSAHLAWYSYDYYTTNPAVVPYLTVTYEYPLKVNISDVWKDVNTVQVNIGDSWKTLSELKVNISDAWKTVF